jgi:hypothetical protein
MFTGLQTAENQAAVGVGGRLRISSAAAAMVSILYCWLQSVSGNWLSKYRARTTEGWYGRVPD